jgi:hypothetical protein
MVVLHVWQKAYYKLCPRVGERGLSRATFNDWRNLLGVRKWKKSLNHSFVPEKTILMAEIMRQVWKSGSLH